MWPTIIVSAVGIVLLAKAKQRSDAQRAARSEELVQRLRERDETRHDAAWERLKQRLEKKQ